MKERSKAAMDRNLTHYNAIIKKDHRHRMNAHRSFILWFTGLSGSGKSTLAHALEAELHDRGIRTYVLDGDNVRMGLNRDLGFSAADRKENIRRIAEVAKLFVDAGVVVLTAFISPYREERTLCRDLVESGEFIEIYVKCPLSVCEQRDVKGLYGKARRGEISQFTAVDAPYETPEDPEITVATGKETITACIDRIIAYLEDNRYVNERCYSETTGQTMPATMERK
jgi:adenylylsulfate kinase